MPCPVITTRFGFVIGFFMVVINPGYCQETEFYIDGVGFYRLTFLGFGPVLSDLFCRVEVADEP